MTSPSSEQLDLRLDAIKHGPWASRLTSARKYLAPRTKLNVPEVHRDVLEFGKIELSKENKKLNKELTTTLRPHYEDSNGVTDPHEIEVRDALDDALTQLQLYELAVETGYLQAEQVAESARSIMIDLLWSPAARRFVKAYDYLAIQMLARRVGVQGLGQVEAVPTDPNASLRFAGFLAHLRSFYVDEQIQQWAALLDDYSSVNCNEQDKLWDYLVGPRKKRASKRNIELIAACQSFVTSLASAFYMLDENELGRFGLIHWYWLRKFFGYEMNALGYVKNIATWGRNDSWADSTSRSQNFVSVDVDREIAEEFLNDYRKKVEVLRRTFEVTKQYAENVRSDSKVGAKDDK